MYKRKPKNIFMLCPAIVFLFVIFFVVAYIYQNILDINNNTGWKIIVIGMLFVFFVCFFVSMGMAKLTCNDFYDLKSIKEDILKCNDTTEYENLAVKISNYYDQIQGGIEEIKSIQKLSDRKIRRIMIGVVTNIFALIFAIFFLLSPTQNSQKAFWIYMEPEGTQYAVVYQNSEHAILKKTKIYDKTIYIDLNCQIILDCEGEMLEYMEFENVEIISD